MTDQTPELLPQVNLPRWWLEQLRDQLFAMKKLPTGYVGDWVFLFREQLNDALESRPTPSERPVAQVREALERTLAEIVECARQTNPSSANARHFAVDNFGRAIISCEILNRWINAIRRALTSERPPEAQIEDEIVRLGSAIMDRRAECPSEAAVAWRWRGRTAVSEVTHWIYDPTPEWREAHVNDPRVELQPLYAIPHLEAVACTEEERHAIAHARHQVEQASPEKPNCCFDFDLVKDLLRVIDRSIQHGDAVREGLTRIKKLVASMDPYKPMSGERAQEIIEICDRAPSPTLASERVSERTGDKQI